LYVRGVRGDCGEARLRAEHPENANLRFGMLAGIPRLRRNPDSVQLIPEFRRIPFISKTNQTCATDGSSFAVSGPMDDLYGEMSPGLARQPR
jgi:hypothetical protein